MKNKDKAVNIDDILKVIKDSGLKLTKQRVGLVRLLYGKGHRHISAEVLHEEALSNGIKMSLATVYNTLRFLYNIGLVNEIKMSTSSLFDTNCHDHAHVLDESTGDLKDFFVDAAHLIKIKQKGCFEQEIKGVDIIFKIQSKQR